MNMPFIMFLLFQKSNSIKMKLVDFIVIFLIIEVDPLNMSQSTPKNNQYCLTLGVNKRKLRLPLDVR